MNTKVLVVFLTLASTVFTSYGQKKAQRNTDSLVAVVPTMKEDTLKVLILKEISFNYYRSNPDKGLEYGRQALTLAEKLKWKKGIADAYNSVASNYFAKSEFAPALEYFTKASALYVAIGNRNEAAKTLINIGSVYVVQANYPKALENYLQALKLAEEQQNLNAISAISANIATIYNNLGNNAKALEYNKKAGEICKKLGDTYGEVQVLANTASIYYENNELSNSLEYNLKALKIAQENNYKNVVGAIYGNIGNIYLKMKEFDLSINNNLQAVAIGKELKDDAMIALGYGNLAGVYLDMATDSNQNLANKNAILLTAKMYADSANILNKDVGDLRNTSANYLKMSEIELKLGNYKAAYENYRKHAILKDSIFNIEKDKKITQTAMQYEFDKKEAATKAEQERKDAQQRIIRYSILAGLLGALIFLIVVYRQRNKIAKEKKRSEELLLNILPAEVAEELKEKGSADAKHIDEVTVLFTDFKGFTQLSEKLSPTELVAEINECFSAFDHIMQKYGVEKIKTIGDAYMAAGGLPTPNNTHPDDVVRAALDIQAFMHEHKIQKEAQGKLYFEIRIGIHTGPVVAGIVGVKKFQYDIWGDTVNTASRMESSGEVGRVNVSGATYELVKDKFTFEHRGKITAKGKGEIDMYFVEG